MELRDVVESLVALDDERRAVINEINRAVDGLERALAGASALRLTMPRLSVLREHLAHGADETPFLRDLGDEVRSRLVEQSKRLLAETWRRAEGGDDLDGTGPAGDRRFERALESTSPDLEDLVGAALDLAEQVGRLSHLVSTRQEVERRLDRTRSGLDPEATELVEVVLAARDAAADRFAHDSLAFLADAERAAKEDGTLAGVAATVRALASALSQGESPESVTRDLARRVVDVALQLAHVRDELKRRLAMQAREVERRQAMTHGLFQAVARASEVLELCGELEEQDGAPEAQDVDRLREACTEHGIIAFVMDMRRVRVPRDALDAAVSDLSAALGELFPLLAEEPERVERLAWLWDDLARVDAGAVEQDWEDAAAEVLGVRADPDGVLAVEPDSRARLASMADLEPVRRELLERLESRREDVAALVHRLERADRILSEIVEEGDEPSKAAAAAKSHLAYFVGEVADTMSSYHGAVREKLTASGEGFARLEAERRPFDVLQGRDPKDEPEAWRAAVESALESVRERYTRLEAEAPTEGGTDWKHEEERVRNETAGAHRSLAATLARLRRLREILLPELAPACRAALDLARQLRTKPESAGELLGDEPAERLGEALEALYSETLYHESLELGGGEMRAVATLVAQRDRRLLDLHGATLTLLFLLLREIAAAHDELEPDERPGHVSWMEELIGHAEHELRRHLDRLEACLFDLADNAERWERYATAFDAYHSWAASVSDTDAGDALLQRHGRALFERFEGPLGDLGTRTLEGLRTAASDWRTSGTCESLIELYRMAVTELESRPTMTDVGSRLAALRGEAEDLRDELVARAEREPSSDGRSVLFP